MHNQPAMPRMWVMAGAMAAIVFVAVATVAGISAVAAVEIGVLVGLTTVVLYAAAHALRFPSGRANPRIGLVAGAVLAGAIFVTAALAAGGSTAMALVGGPGVVVGTIVIGYAIAGSHTWSSHPHR